MCIKARVKVVPCTVRAVAVAGIKLVGIPQPKPMHRFLPNFQGMFTIRESRADMATLSRFLGLKVCWC